MNDIRPKQSKFLGRVYKFVYVPELVSGDDELYGLCVHDEQKIYIQEGQLPDIEKSTILHEVLHQLLLTLEMDTPTEERVVNHLGHSIIAHMKDNKKFWEFLKK